MARRLFVIGNDTFSALNDRGIIIIIFMIFFCYF